MNYHRLLVLVGGDAKLSGIVAALRMEGPAIQHLVVVRIAGGDAAAATATTDTDQLTPAPPFSLWQVDAPELGSETLAALCAAESIDLVIDGLRTPQSVAALYRLRRLHPLPILFGLGAPPHHAQRRVWCLAIGARARASIRTFLRDHADPSMRISLIGPHAPTSDQLASLMAMGGIQATVEERPRSALSRRPAAYWLPADAADLMVCAQLPALALLGTRRTAQVLLLPPTPRTAAAGALDVADIADLGSPLRTRLETVARVGAQPALPDQGITCVSGGKPVATADVQEGALTLPALPGVRTLGVYRNAAHAKADPLAAIEQHIDILRPAGRPLLLCDADVDSEILRELVQREPQREPLLVRLRPTRSCRSIRERLRALGLPARVLDARAVLDEGPALDVSEAVDGVRLARVAATLQRAGFPIEATLHRGVVSTLPTARHDAEPTPGNRVELELDNAVALRWLLEAIASSTSSLHVQVYMAADDHVGAAVEDALAAAAGRGVTVRVLVDSLHGLHESLGTTNPLLARLAARPGVEVRTARPIREVPSLLDLKQRDHRKLVVADGRLALVSGRNLAHEYYVALEDAQLTAETPWREVPWLDAGARLAGPAVAEVQTAFRQAWMEAGGAGFDVKVPPPAGTSKVRVVVHHGLRDARTLEAYLDLIGSARSHVIVVNAFPLMLELQHALLAALRRGAHVRVLSAHLVTAHDGQPFPGAFVAGRTAAADLVYSRLDPLVAAGAEVAYFAVHRASPSSASPSSASPSSASLGTLHPYVHAKLLSVDGERCAVGSANLDITAAYWESEIMLVVEDPAVVGDVEARIARLMQPAPRVERDDPAWQQLARRRSWMRHWPGVLSP